MASEPEERGPTAGQGAASTPSAQQDDFSKRLQAQMRGAGAGEAAEPQAAGEQEPAESTGPVGQGEHVVRPDECISSIAEEHGFFWETIWNEPANSELKQVRRNPNVLLPGDRVTIPEKRRRDEPAAAEQRHRFKRKGEPSHLRLQILDDDEPVANQPFELRVDGETYSGTTDADGKIDVAIPGDARRARLVVGTEPDVFKYMLELGRTEPVETNEGVQQRLHNLGFLAVTVNGRVDEPTQTALRAFQKRNGLEETGQPDRATREKLKEKHLS